jgi:hypothetical protein
MNHPSWRSEDGQLLRSLREAAGIDELVFARQNTVSLAQLKELELGGNSSFYNPGIKHSTGIKLLRRLGHELATPVPLALSAVSRVPTPSEPGPSLTPALVQPRTSNPEKLNASSRRGVLPASVFWILCLFSAGVLVVFKPWESKNSASIHLTSAAPVNTTAVKLESSDTPAPSEVVAQAPSTDNGTTLTPLAKATAAPVTSACDWQHRVNSKAHTPSEPIKPGNYVYLEAQADTELCVIDSQNQKTMLQLKAGMAKSVYGSAPFLIHSQDWQNLKLFFQGRRVQETLNGVQHLLLNSHPL